MDIFTLIQALVQGASTLLEAQQNKTAQTIGTDLAAANTVVLAILQKNAEVQGLTIDWTDPDQVGAYVASLAPFVPIPEPDAAGPGLPGGAVFSSVEPAVPLIGQPSQPAPTDAAGPNTDKPAAG